jgi:hypothetical protein
LPQIIQEIVVKLSELSFEPKSLRPKSLCLASMTTILSLAARWPMSALAISAFATYSFQAVLGRGLSDAASDEQEDLNRGRLVRHFGFHSRAKRGALPCADKNAAQINALPADGVN